MNKNFKYTYLIIYLYNIEISDATKYGYSVSNTLRNLMNRLNLSTLNNITPSVLKFKFDLFEEFLLHLTMNMYTDENKKTKNKLYNEFLNIKEFFKIGNIYKIDCDENFLKENMLYNVLTYINDNNINIENCDITDDILIYF